MFLQWNAVTTLNVYMCMPVCVCVFVCVFVCVCVCVKHKTYTNINQDKKNPAQHAKDNNKWQ